jgi:hypothetical protein
MPLNLKKYSNGPCGPRKDGVRGEETWESTGGDDSHRDWLKTRWGITCDREKTRQIGMALEVLEAFSFCGTHTHLLLQFSTNAHRQVAALWTDFTTSLGGRNGSWCIALKGGVSHAERDHSSNLGTPHNGRIDHLLEPSNDLTPPSCCTQSVFNNISPKLPQNFRMVLTVIVDAVVVAVHDTK